MLKRTLLFSTALALALGLRAAPGPFNGSTPLEWSQKMASSEITRLMAGSKDGVPAKWRWDYTTSLFALSVLQLGEKTGSPEFPDFAFKAMESCVAPDGSIKGFKLEDYNIDAVAPGRMLFPLYSKTKDERYRKALETLRSQMRSHPRTSEGGFWHKKRYPHQMWLDGLFMGSPFLAQYSVAFKEPELRSEVCRQIVLMDRHAYDPKSGLYYHAWDEQRAQGWADKKSGVSPHFWSRSIGWYAMAIVDCLDYIPASQPEIDDVTNILRRVADGIAKHQDPASGLWWQITDQGSRKGNYLEASGSAMFVYALAKGVNKGYLPRELFEPVILKGYAGLVSRLIKADDKGLISLTQNCSVAGLGYTNSAGRSRDGSFDYYVSEPIVDNDHKGVGPFILAGIEVDALLARKPGAATAEHVAGWEYADKILARIKAPVFPAKDFPITDFGAKSDGTECTEALRKAIEACATAGGGRVVVPAGLWLTAAVTLKSGVNLHLVEGSTLKFLFEPAKYPVVFTRWEGVELMNYSALIYAHGQKNIAVTGKGTLDGGATWETWWSWNNKVNVDKTKQQGAARKRLIEMAEKGVPVEQRVFGEGSFLRPNFVQFYRCENVLVEGLTIINSPMWEIHPALCTNVTVRGLKISSHGPNNDGCNPESSRDVLIENCVFDTGDDCIAIKSGRNTDGRRVNVPSENLIIRGCVMKDGHGGVVIGSETSGGCRNVFVEDCKMDSANLDRALRIKSNAVRGGVIENIFMRRVTINQVKEAVLTIDLLYEEGAKGNFPPTIRNIAIERTEASASPRVMFIRGFEGAVIDGIRFSDCTFKGVSAPEVLSGAGSVLLRNVNIVPASKPKSANSVGDAN